MIAKILGIFDLLAALLLVLIAAGTHVPSYFLIAGAVVLLVKSVPFIFGGCIACFIDVAGAVLLILSIFFTLPVWILVIGIVAVAQKGFLSLI